MPLLLLQLADFGLIGGIRWDCARMEALRLARWRLSHALVLGTVLILPLGNRLLILQFLLLKGFFLSFALLHLELLSFFALKCLLLLLLRLFLLLKALPL